MQNLPYHYEKHVCRSFITDELYIDVKKDEKGEKEPNDGSISKSYHLKFSPDTRKYFKIMDLSEKLTYELKSVCIIFLEPSDAIFPSKMLRLYSVLLSMLNIQINTLIK